MKTKHEDRVRIAAYGDFQTPPALASQVCRLLAETIEPPACIVEPNCGVGNLLFAAHTTFPNAARSIGVEINPAYVARARARALSRANRQMIEIIEGDFFNTDWQTIIAACPEPLLVVGNPPWVTNTHLSRLNSSNAPRKSNEQGFAGYDAITGKSNFDISEWMLVRLLEWLDGRSATLAMLCKTSVARKVLAHAWRSGRRMTSANMYSIDAREHFGAAVDACLLVCTLAQSPSCQECSVFEGLSERRCISAIGYSNGQLIADIDLYRRSIELAGPERYKWRSGVKHDCSRVMELRCRNSSYVNSLDENVDIEDDYVFPLFKSADIARGRLQEPMRYMLITQRKVGDDTRIIQRLAPRTWQYLQSHAQMLDARRSSIYTRQPRFAMFGVGQYTFAPWKVAVSGLYKDPVFRVVPPFSGKPSVLDDTCYFVACASDEEATYIASLLNSEPASQFYRALMFADAKRPITIDLLRRLDLAAVARSLGRESMFDTFQQERTGAGQRAPALATVQPALFT